MSGRVLGVVLLAASVLVWGAVPGPGRHGALAQPAAGLERFATSALSIRTANGVRRFTVELARTRRQQIRGLMFRRRLARDAGMLFLYDRPAPIQMWMKNTYIPLDMLFIAGDGRIRRIVERTVPLSLETIASGGPVSAVLELNAGTAARLGIRVGDRVVHPAFAAAR